MSRESKCHIWKIYITAAVDLLIGFYGFVLQVFGHPSLLDLEDDVEGDVDDDVKDDVENNEEEDDEDDVV